MAAAALLAAYRHPGRALRRALTGARREDRALARLMAAAGLIFVASWPRALRGADAVPVEARLAGALVATIFLLPLLAYGLAALSHLAAWALGGRGSGYGARLALFRALLAAAPLMLVQSLAAAVTGTGWLSALSGGAVFVAFLWLWLAGFGAAEFATRDMGADDV